jgi:plasmid maintenance system antidote protein VapI
VDTHYGGPKETLRLGHFFGTSAEFWLNPQKIYEASGRRAGEWLAH